MFSQHVQGEMPEAELLTPSTRTGLQREPESLHQRCVSRIGAKPIPMGLDRDSEDVRILRLDSAIEPDEGGILFAKPRIRNRDLDRWDILFPRQGHALF